MKRANAKPRSTKHLRRAAETRLASARPGPLEPDPDPKRLLHELQVHQVELEMQNEELRRTQVELEESRGRYWALYDHAPFGYLTLERNGTIVDANLTVSEQLGVDRSRLVGLRLSGFMTAPDADRFLLHQLAAVARWKTETCDLELRRADGHVIQARLETAPQMHEGTPRFHTVLVDISDLHQAEQELRESETRFRQLAEHIEDVFYVRELPGEVSYVSATFEDIWGRPAAWLIGRDAAWLDTVDPEDQARVAAAWARLNKGAPMNDIYRIRRPDGTARWVHCRGFPVVGEAGKVLRNVGVVRDVTNERARESELRQAQKMEAVGTLAGGFAHNVRNVLQAVTGSIHVAQMTEIGAPERVRALALAATAVKRGATLIDQLMTLARKQESSLKLWPVRVDESIRETAGLLSSLIGAQISIELETAAPMGVVMADSVQLEQILLNLATNARDAMPDGGTLSIRSREAMLDEPTARSHGVVPGPYVIITVADNGGGMDLDTKTHIFEPFFTTKGVGKGTGLGLSTVFGLVREFGGYIDVESEPGHGTTFSIGFPVLQNRMADEDEVPA